jgi:hypothetical protein
MAICSVVSVSPDGQSILDLPEDEADCDIMLVDPFRYIVFDVGKSIVGGILQGAGGRGGVCYGG